MHYWPAALLRGTSLIAGFSSLDIADEHAEEKRWKYLTMATINSRKRVRRELVSAHTELKLGTG
jgi:hypothetical protein